MTMTMRIFRKNPSMGCAAGDSDMQRKGIEIDRRVQNWWCYSKQQWIEETWCYRMGYSEITCWVSYSHHIPTYTLINVIILQYMIYLHGTTTCAGSSECKKKMLPLKIQAAFAFFDLWSRPWPDGCFDVASNKKSSGNDSLVMTNKANEHGTLIVDWPIIY